MYSLMLALCVIEYVKSAVTVRIRGALTVTKAERLMVSVFGFFAFSVACVSIGYLYGPSCSSEQPEERKRTHKRGETDSRKTIKSMLHYLKISFGDGREGELTC